MRTKILDVHLIFDVIYFFLYNAQSIVKVNYPTTKSKLIYVRFFLVGINVYYIHCAIIFVFADKNNTLKYLSLFYFKNKTIDFYSTVITFLTCSFLLSIDQFDEIK